MTTFANSETKFDGIAQCGVSGFSQNIVYEHGRYALTLKTQDRLRNHQSLLLSLCEQRDENCKHLYFNCAFSMEVCSKVKYSVGFSSVVILKERMEFYSPSLQQKIGNKRDIQIYSLYFLILYLERKESQEICKHSHECKLP